MPIVKETMMNVKPSYRLEIDGLRALAVIAVILNHFNKNILPSGYLGVDIFFVISGFVITSSLLDRPVASFGCFLTEFYTRRIKRLAPALVIFVSLTGILICLFNPSPAASLKTGITALFGLSNLYLLKQSTDYFAASTELNVFTHTWSLGVEEQFYLVFPFLVWLTRCDRLAVNGSRNLSIIIGVLSATSLVFFAFLYQVNQPAAYFLMPTRIWELGAGCLLSLGLKHSTLGFLAIQRVQPTLVIVALVSVLSIPFRFAIQATVAVVILTVMLIACVRNDTAAYNILTRPSIIYIGKISYSLYLWHWGVLSLSHWTVSVQWWTAPFQIVLMLLLASISYWYIELPLRHSEWSGYRLSAIGYRLSAIGYRLSAIGYRLSAIGYGIIALSSAAVFMGLLIKISPILYSGRTPDLVAVGVASLTDPYFLSVVGSRWEGEECVLSDNSQVGKNIPIEKCTLGNFSTAKKRVLILGNSYSAAFTQAFDNLVAEDGYAVTITSSWGASPVKEVQNLEAWDRANEYYWKTIAPTLIARLMPGDWVFLVNDMSSFSPWERSWESDNRLQQLKSGLEILSRKLTINNIQLGVLHGIPFAREANCQPVSAAKQWFNPFGSPCRLPNRKDSLLRREGLDTALVSLQQRGEIRIVDIFNVFCPDSDCTYYAANGQILYRDEFSHPSVEAARLSSSVIRGILTSSD